VAKSAHFGCGSCGRTRAPRREKVEFVRGKQRNPRSAGRHSLGHTRQEAEARPNAAMSYLCQTRDNKRSGGLFGCSID
jgi:hypothetical protein